MSRKNYRLDETVLRRAPMPVDWPDDFGVPPVKVERPLLEHDVQEACVKFARSRGFWARKFSSPANRSVPDYLFGKKYAERVVIWAEEFKAPGKHPTDAQEEEQKLMREAGWAVYHETGTNGQADIEWFKRRIVAVDEEFA